MSKMEYTIPENEFSELTVKRGELGGFLVKIVAKDKLLEAGFSSMANVVQYINVVLGVTGVSGELGSQNAPSSAKVLAPLKVSEIPAKEPKKRGRKPGQKSAPKPETALTAAS